jgi:hypothetical protein
MKCLLRTVSKYVVQYIKAKKEINDRERGDGKQSVDMQHATSYVLATHWTCREVLCTLS